MNPKEWMSIPVLPCLSLDETVAFWEMLGYERSYYQKSPYGYAVIERGGYALHFIQQKGLNIEENPQGCLVMVSDVEAVHQEFSRQWKEALGRVPNKGLPRISRMRPKQTRFTITDPSGNWVIFIKFGEEDQETWSDADKEGQSRLEQALARAIRFRDFKNDNDFAAKVLDAALKRLGDEEKSLIAKVHLVRAELALDMEDAELAKAHLEKFSNLGLSEAETRVFREDLERLDKLLNS